MIEVDFNGRIEPINSIEELSVALDRFDAELRFELWISIPEGPSIAMLRNGDHAWLMYLREPGDSGLRSIGNEAALGNERYLLSNGQMDEYPLAWCIPLEECYRALAYFYVNAGARYDRLRWHEEE